MKTRSLVTIVTLGLAMGLGACASAPDTAAEAAEAPAKSCNKGASDAVKAAAHDADANAPACPVEDLNNDVAVSDVDGGLAIDVTTTGDAMALRAQMAERVAWMAAQSAGKPSPVESRLEDIDGGFRRVLTPKDPAKLDAMRANIRAHIAEERALHGAVPEAMPACALEVPETNGNIVDVEGGLMVEITTTGDLAEVRRRVYGRDNFAKANPKPMPFEMTKTLEEIPGGMRITFIAKDAAKVDQMRAALRERLGGGAK